ncbi:MAG: cupin domain-containing protein [Salinarimonas sp.]|nr:cupin domain-containing protein [Salinarimonas sp.]
MNKAVSEIQAEDEKMRITRWTFAPATETGWHRHPYPYAVVPVQGGILTVVDDEGERDYPIRTGESYARSCGIEHNIVNNSNAPIVFVEIEIKR